MLMKKCIFFSKLIAIAVLATVSCATDHNNPLTGRWKVVTYTDPFKATLGATTVGPDEVYTLQFNDEGSFSFTTDCNIISGEYTFTPKELHFADLSATEMACEKEVVERSIKSQLPMVKSYKLSGDSTLSLIGERNNVMIQLEKVRDNAQNITEASPSPKLILSLTSDSLLTCCNNFNGKDQTPLVLDTTNPALADFLAQWINSLDSIQKQKLQESYLLHITVGADVSDSSVEKVKRAVKECGVEKISLSNFDIE